VKCADEGLVLCICMRMTVSMCAFRCMCMLYACICECVHAQATLQSAVLKCADEGLLLCRESVCVAVCMHVSAHVHLYACERGYHLNLHYAYMHLRHFSSSAYIHTQTCISDTSRVPHTYTHRHASPTLLEFQYLCVFIRIHTHTDMHLPHLCRI
jgi:hypothetical protein